ncbi:hypothetical protein [Bilophila wadsworthia]
MPPFAASVITHSNAISLAAFTVPLAEPQRDEFNERGENIEDGPHITSPSRP